MRKHHGGRSRWARRGSGSSARRRVRRRLVTVAGVAGLVAGSLAAVPAAGAPDASMAKGEHGWKVKPVFTVGETFSGTSGALNPTTAGDYTPPGILDGLGAYALDKSTVRVFANHELLNNRGYDYQVSDGKGGTYTLDGSRISYFDIDKKTHQIVDTGLAYNTIYDANGNVTGDPSFLANGFAGFSRFCSGSLFEAHEFEGGKGDGPRGLENRIYFAGEEDGGGFNPVGGGEWALDPDTGNLWHVPALGRGAWENITVMDSGDPSKVVILLADDTSPFDVDDDGEDEAAPLYLYVGEKDPKGDFLARNGLRDGKLHVWVSNTGETTPADFNGSGYLWGKWVEIDNSPTGEPSEDGSTGFDEFGYPTQRTLWKRAEELGAFGFSRPEDVATNPSRGFQAVLASTGVDSYVDGVDTFGTIYTITAHFNAKGAKGKLTILYDGDADPKRQLRSPDNLDWADDGHIYVQEDKAEDESLSGEPLFGEGAANPYEAGIVRMNARGKRLERIASVDREVVLDPTTAGTPVDVDAGEAGAWETSGILDVSTLFGKHAGTMFLFDVQAHGIADQTTDPPDGAGNADSRINDDDLVEGGQLSVLLAPQAHDDTGGKGA